MDLFVPRFYLVVRPQEPLQIQTAFRLNPQGVDLHPPRSPVVGGCDREAVTHRVQQMAGRADVLAASKKSYRLIARQLVRLLPGVIHTTLFVTGEGRIHNGAALPVCRAAEFELRGFRIGFEIGKSSRLSRRRPHR